MSTQERQLSSYNEFIKSLSLEEIVLLLLEAQRTSHSPAPGELEVSLKSDFHLLDHPANQLRARADFDLKVTDSQKEKAFEIRIQFMLTYRSNMEYSLSEEEKQQFLSRNVPVNVWPYARELISTMATRLGYPALLIPPYVVIG
jgi:preprotein translocase subunit SecB